MRKTVPLILGLLLGWHSLGVAQLAVVDAPNLVRNTVTSVQSVITAAHMVLSVENQILELTPVDEIIVAGAIAEDLAALADIVVQAEGLSYDLQSLNAQIHVLFDLETAPNTRTGLEERLVEIKRLAFQARTFAARTQTLLLTVYRTVDHLTKLIDSIGAFVGAKQGSQTLVQAQSTVSKTLAVMETQQAAWQRSETVDKMSEALIIESITRIEARRLEGWPGMVGSTQ